jgi:hypothetical protein
MPVRDKTSFSGRPHNEETVVKPSERILARNEKHLQIISGRQGSAEG